MSGMPTQCGAADVKNNRSIHSDSLDEVHNVPMEVIIRPIPPVLDELKVEGLMKTIKVTMFYVLFKVALRSNKMLGLQHCCGLAPQCKIIFIQVHVNICAILI